MMDLTRRSFLKLSGAAAAAGIVVPAWTPPRAPYVVEGEVVSFVGIFGRNLPPRGFTGGEIVREVNQWDGVGYPCELRSGFGCTPRAKTFYDFDLCNFRRELPPRFWADPAREHRYANVHSYIREQRFGEEPEEMWQRLGYGGALLEAA